MGKDNIKVEYIETDKLIPYANNARKHGEVDVDAIMASIREFGFTNPILTWKGIVAAGHGRLIAAKRLGLDKVPTIALDYLTDEQRRAYILADNKTAELSTWDFNISATELKSISEIDMSLFGFNEKSAGSWFDDRKEWDDEREDGNDEYNEFIEKFETKKTTDDCYTPNNIYEAVSGWVANEYGVDKSAFVRPFYPGGDYQKENYPDGCVVVDNPPFSILAEILKFYTDRKIKFFLFAPTLTLFSSSSSSSCAIGVGVGVTYENGATVNTSFLTNLEGARARSAPTLYEAVKEKNDENLKRIHAELPKYEYPDEVLTSSTLAYMSKYGESFSVSRSSSKHTRALDSQKEKGKDIFGSGYLLSEKAAAEKAAAEKAAAEKAAAEKAAAEKWELSDREKEIVKSLK